jgi:hypothetical protein
VGVPGAPSIQKLLSCVSLRAGLPLQGKAQDICILSGRLRGKLDAQAIRVLDCFNALATLVLEIL